MKGLKITLTEEPGILMDMTWDKNGELDRISFLAEVVDGQAEDHPDPAELAASDWLLVRRNKDGRRCRRRPLVPGGAA